MDRQLNLVNDPEACYATPDDLPTAVPETATEMNIFEQKAEVDEYEVDPSWRSSEHGKTGLTQDPTETDENDNLLAPSDEPGTSNDGKQAGTSTTEAVEKEQSKNEDPVKKLGKTTMTVDEINIYWYEIRLKLMKFRGEDVL